VTKPIPTTPPLLLTYAQAARELQISDRTLWTLVNEKRLKSVRFAGRTVRIDRRDLEAFIQLSKGGSHDTP
jgi:excisionase family DNA binding protein